ncbi:hypothetical protein [Nocardia abscessus]|uniref:Uncharacterized protein n=1 Tax=Nocardia abscessus TaxID=120957 RepID=A0ABS0CGD6_9NOCA|nr:hypothetical protein [Nocardia abscessus]MBF6229395.1 hypothetical protein [Nocardia abscessus]
MSADHRADSATAVRVVELGTHIGAQIDGAGEVPVGVEGTPSTVIAGDAEYYSAADSLTRAA